jgi:hypothetical protein
MADRPWENDVIFTVDAFVADSEGEDDLDKPDLRKLNQAVVAASDWTTETILRQLDRGNINLNPSFQRRDAWTVQRKSRFIESLILGLPRRAAGPDHRAEKKSQVGRRRADQPAFPSRRSGDSRVQEKLDDRM